MAEWDDDNFDVDFAKPSSANKWEGEDEEEEVKESWEDEDEEKKIEEKRAEEAADVKSKSKKKSIQEKIAEKERLKREEYEKRLKEQEEEVTAEELLRREKESDLNAALETTFGGSNKNLNEPTTKEEFQEMSDSLTKNIQQYSKSEEYPNFAENLVRGICATLTSYDLKKVKTTIDNLYLEKQKLEKGDKAKKNKGKGKAKLKLDGDNLNQYSAYVDDYVEYDDFM